MTDIYEFEGKTLCNTNSVLGEGPTYDPDSNTVWWFNILGKELHELNLSTSEKKVHPLPVMASVLARIDAGRQLIATEEGLFVRDVANGNLTFYAALENDRPENRSNDGRTHPSGALWIGTMSKRAENQAGAIYHGHNDDDRGINLLIDKSADDCRQRKIRADRQVDAARQDNELLPHCYNSNHCCLRQDVPQVNRL